MAKHVTQETFDSVVHESITEFEMDAEEAVQEAVTQFESQGVDLSNIVRDATLYSTSSDAPTQHPVVTAINNLTAALQANHHHDILNNLDLLRTECDVDLSKRCLAGSHGGYDVLLNACTQHRTSPEILAPTLSTFCALCNGQPDLLDDNGISVLISLLAEYETDPTLLELIIRLICLNCVKHEGNRQKFVGVGIVPKSVTVLKQHRDCAAIVKVVCTLLRTLTFDDDIRVPFGKAHDHAKLIVAEHGGLHALFEISNAYTSNRSVLAEIFSTLGKLVVRDEYCAEVLKLRGVEFFIKAIQENMDNKKLVQQALGFMQAVCGNDDAKVCVASQGGIALTTTCMNIHQGVPGIADVGASLLATLTLRNPNNCKLAIEANAHEVICQAMKIHPGYSQVQKQSCMALRNLVARSREYSDTILTLGAEYLIQAAVTTHPDCADEGKAALRDLGCKVELKEIWKGEKGSLTYD